MKNFKVILTTIILTGIFSYHALNAFTAFVLSEKITSGNISELGEFSVIKNEDKVEIKWCILHENHSIRYIIEKSKDGKKFSKLSDVPSAANDSNFHEYFETDFKPATFYRLKQITDDNVVHYSNVVYVKSDESSDFAAKWKNLSGEISENVNKQVLVLLRDQIGNEFSAKVILNMVNETLTGVDEDKIVKKGTYLVVASKVEALCGFKINIR